jgi:hypothetical protein
MHPMIEMQTNDCLEKHGLCDEAQSIFLVRSMECLWVDDFLGVRMHLSCEEDQPDEYPPPDVATLSLLFTRNDWAAFRAYVDSYFAD